MPQRLRSRHVHVTHACTPGDRRFFGVRIYEPAVWRRTVPGTKAALHRLRRETLVEVLMAGLWGFVGGASLLVGEIIGLW